MRDVAAANCYCRNVFEAEVVYKNRAFAFLTYDNEHHRFAFANLDVLKHGDESRDERGEIGVNHVAYTYANLGDLSRGGPASTV